MQKVLWEGDTPHGHYQVTDTVYDGRDARVLYSGNRQAAQSGVPKDGKPDLLFDYNQRLFELTINLVPKRVLLIGGGVFTLPTALLHVLPSTVIDVVEPDPGLQEIAARYFGPLDNDRLTIYNTDGRTFLKEHATPYDLILIDAYNHTSIPREIKTLQAFEAYHNHLERTGVLAMNVISGYHGQNAHVLQEVYGAALRTFDAVDLFLATRGYSLWLPQNFVLTAQKNQNLPLRDYVRYDAVKPPNIDFNLILED